MSAAYAPSASPSSPLPTNPLAGSVAIVTGATAGIGRAIVESLVVAGVNCVAAARGEEGLNLLARELEGGPGEVMGISADVSRPSDIEQLVATALDRYGHVHHLVNVAGDGRHGGFLELVDGDWDHLWETNVKSVIRMSRAVLPGMVERGDGRIVNIAGVLGIEPQAGQSCSAVSKAAILHLTKCMAVEFAPHDVLVNAVTPGFTLTPRWQGYVEAEAERLERSVESVLESRVANTGLQRWAEPREIAGAVVFLLSPAARFISGTSITADGGLLNSRD